MAEGWPVGPLVEALRALRGLDFVSAATFIAAVGDLTRFENTPQSMWYLGLVHSEQSTGDRRGAVASPRPAIPKRAAC